MARLIECWNHVEPRFFVLFWRLRDPQHHSTEIVSVNSQITTEGGGIKMSVSGWIQR